MQFKRVFLVVLDSLGVGEAVDAINYDDAGCNTLGHIKENYDLFIPNLKKLGFLNTINMDDNRSVEAYYTIARPTNPGKDTLTGHYELMGVQNMVSFKDFSQNGIPRELIDKIEEYTKVKVIGNKNAIGIDIINELGERQIAYKTLILYTSNGSNIYVAAHEDVIPVAKLYDYCEIIRKITLQEEWKVGRVIAKPFSGKPGKFKFTNEKKEYAVKPPMGSVLNALKDNNFSVISIGKISDVFSGEGISKIMKASSNTEALNKLSDIMEKNFTGLCFCNLPDFDEAAHKHDIEEYGRLIEEFDVEVPMLLNRLNNDDLLIFTADHGCDCTCKEYEHTRENVPVIIFSRSFKEPKRLEIMESMANIGATISDNFGLAAPFIGKSILEKLK